NDAVADFTCAAASDAGSPAAAVVLDEPAAAVGRVHRRTTSTSRTSPRARYGLRWNRSPFSARLPPGPSAMVVSTTVPVATRGVLLCLASIAARNAARDRGGILFHTLMIVPIFVVRSTRRGSMILRTASRVIPK